MVSTVVPCATNARISTRSSTRVSAFLSSARRDQTVRTRRVKTRSS
jgi:hypothetical protein